MSSTTTTNSPTTTAKPRSADRVETLISAIDIYEPHLIGRHEDLFRVFARFVSRSIDARYLERHPPAELLPDLEHLFHGISQRKRDEIRVRVTQPDQSSQRRGVLIVCMPDMQFTYSTTRLAIDHLGIRTYRTINTVVPVRRDEQGAVDGVGITGAPVESIIWVEIEADDLLKRRDEIESYIAGRLSTLQVCISDFQAMRGVLETTAARFEALARDKSEMRAKLEEDARMLRWMLDEHFVIVGTRLLPAAGQNGSAPKDQAFGSGRFADWRGLTIEDGDKRALGGETPYLNLRKSGAESWVYRAGRLNHIVLQAFDDRNQANGIIVVEGLFSFQGLASPRTEIPRLDRKVTELYTLLGAQRGSHLFRSARNAFNALPLEYIFGLSIDDIRALVDRIMSAENERRISVHFTHDAAQSTVFAFIALPRTHYDDELRAHIKQLLKERFKASAIDDGVYAGEGEAVSFHFYLSGVQALSEADETTLRTEIEQMASPWAERLYDELRKRHGVSDARRLHELYASAFGPRYQEETSIARAVSDIELLESLSDQNPFDCDIYREKVDEQASITRLRLYESQTLFLSNIMPILDNFGLIVIDQFPTTVRAPGKKERVVSTFRIRWADAPQPTGQGTGAENDLVQRRNRLRSAIKAVVLGAMDNDQLNRLLLRADITYSTTALIRAYSHYAKQIGLAHGETAIRDILLRHPEVVKALSELFRAKFDPDFEGLSPTTVDDKRLEVLARARRSVDLLLEGVTDLTADQVLRTFANLIDATVRTNFYRRDEAREHHIVLKFIPEKVTRMPDPRPYREILVHHPLVAGLHLRMGPVARGGIRWSDRRNDYRTEVLGLMATQNLKNVLIVPRGAKGAFILKDPPQGAAERRKAADELYKIFIGGLLDVTDNLVGNDKVTPPRVLCYEDKDHYLVVAADKGTAHLSDTANALALARGFWLGDAFASGGSKGYDHKKEGITARGAWECVKRHFKEMNINPEADRIRVVGIGDMSGDVFGNGMLLSRKMQLIAAFDHRNIFLDPTPDPEASFSIRKKLFETPGSSWEDYPANMISTGGGVFPRRAKSIALSPEVRTALGVTAEALSGNEVVQAILRAPVDLWWNGGIGNYIKASHESHIDVGDATNDVVRVDATEIRARVVSEGGNLGITQEGRIELASRGVRLNTDAIDNSAGVDLSDHEVNLKILFERLIAASSMTREARDELMERVRVEVDLTVLQNNWVQSRGISLDEIRSKQNINRFQRAVAFLSDRIPFKRRDMHLPGERIFTQRQQRNEGMTRPELSVMLQLAKQDMRNELAKESRLMLDQLSGELCAYFPPVIVEKLAGPVREHPLGINIARTILVNGVAGDAGASWLAETTLRTGRSASDILVSYARASKLVNAIALKRQVAVAESKVSTDVEYRMRLAIEDAIEKVASWLLRRDLALAEPLGPSIQALLTRASEVIPPEDMAGANAAKADYQNAGAGEELAANVANLAFVESAMDIAWIAQLASRGEQPLGDVAKAYFTLGSATGIAALSKQQAQVAGQTEEVDSPAHFALRDRLRKHWAQMTANVMQHGGLGGETATRLQESVKRELAPLASSSTGLVGLVMAADRIERTVS